jgi:hypothetical protein
MIVQAVLEERQTLAGGGARADGRASLSKEALDGFDVAASSGRRCGAGMARLIDNRRVRGNLLPLLLPWPA